MVFMAFLEFYQHRDLFATGGAPRGPKVEHNYPPPPLRQPASLAVEIGKGKIHQYRGGFLRLPMGKPLEAAITRRQRGQRGGDQKAVSEESRHRSESGSI